ncbi:hypothetical protein Tsp_04302 [Trichinella spiralis]|uniref:hypothetical protein n=1 Tax=Trichinella spiralis TaxID=6334 RepID=UPI0001EFC2EC|nr:hypothetical protein Tsp_04302 [Trichinella spiralis]
MDNARSAPTYIATLFQTELANNQKLSAIVMMQKPRNLGATFTSCARDHDRSAFDVLNASIILNIAPRPASINLRKTLDTAGQCSITDLVKQSEKRSCKLLPHKYDTEKQLRKIYPDASESHATLPLIFGQN